MRIGLLGDLHDNPAPADRWIRIVQPDFCIQVGDYWCYDHPWSVPVYWMFGNHERDSYLKRIVAGKFEFPVNSHWLKGGIADIHGVRVMALPGLPKPGDAPGPAWYPPKVYELCRSQIGERVDILASHGCGFPFWHFLFNRVTMRSVRKNFEEPNITDLIRQVRPTYAVSGHNHRFAIEEHEGITCIRLGDTKHTGSFAHLIEI